MDHTNSQTEHGNSDGFKETDFENEEGKSVSLLTLYRYLSKRYYLLVFIGGISAVTSGAAYITLQL